MILLEAGDGFLAQTQTSSRARRWGTYSVEEAEDNRKRWSPTVDWTVKIYPDSIKIQLDKIVSVVQAKQMNSQIQLLAAIFEVLA